MYLCGVVGRMQALVENLGVGVIKTIAIRGGVGLCVSHACGEHIVRYPT